MSRLKIKRNTTNSDAPENTQLVRGELAFNEATESLYIGKGTSGSTADEIVNLGGKIYPLSINSLGVILSISFP